MRRRGSKQINRNCLYFCGFKNSTQPPSSLLRVTNPSERPEHVGETLPGVSETQWELRRVGRGFLVKNRFGKHFSSLPVGDSQQDQHIKAL